MKNLLLGIALVLPLAAPAQNLNVIGWQDGKEIIENLSSQNYHKLVSQTEIALEELIQSEFNDLDQKGISYKLTTICFGIGASGEIGIGPWKVGTGFRQRFYYKR